MMIKAGIKAAFLSRGVIQCIKIAWHSQKTIPSGWSRYKGTKKNQITVGG